MGKDMGRGNDVARHSCWVFSKSSECKKEKGFCVRQNGADQNDGVIKINSLDGNTRDREKVCLDACNKHPGATGCETIWDQGNRGCYVHTKDIARGNDVARHSCWVFSKSSECKKEKGFCVRQNG